MLNLSEMETMSFSLVHICIHTKENYTGVDPKQDDAWPLPTWGAIGIPGYLEAGDTTWGLGILGVGNNLIQIVCAREIPFILYVCVSARIFRMFLWGLTTQELFLF